MSPLTLLIPSSLNGEPGLFAALPGVLGSRSWPDWPGGPGGVVGPSGSGGLDPPPRIPRSGGSSLSILRLLCVRGVGKLSGAAWFSATEPVKRGPTNVSKRPARGESAGASLLFRGSSRLLGRFLVVPADSVGWDVADGRTTHIWAVFEPPRNFGLDGELAPDSATHPSTRRQLRNRRLDGG
jgi:hypothetical protein